MDLLQALKNLADALESGVVHHYHYVCTALCSLVTGLPHPALLTTTSTTSFAPTPAWLVGPTGQAASVDGCMCCPSNYHPLNLRLLSVGYPNNYQSLPIIKNYKSGCPNNYNSRSLP